MFMISLLTLSVMLFARDPKIVHAYVIVSALTDIPHWASFYYVLGWEGIVNYGEWNLSLWLQLGVPVVTMVFKLGYLSGVFGRDRVVGEGKGKGKGKGGKGL
jgi:hypothetical protein